MPSAFVTFVLVPLLSFLVWVITLEFTGGHLAPTPSHRGPQLPDSFVELFAAVDLTSASTVYNMKPPVGPVLNGIALRLFAALLRVPLVGHLVATKLAQDNGLQELVDFVTRLPARFHEPMWYPWAPPTAEQVAAAAPVNAAAADAAAAAEPADGVPAWVTNSRIADLARAFRSGKLCPVEHVKSVLANIRSSNATLRAFVEVDETGALASARLSKERIKSGRTLGVLDGVPVGVKTELSVRGMVYDWGSRMRAGVRATEDSRIVEKLRKSGAIIVGVTNMVEWGASTSGFNGLYGASRNPYGDGAYLTGGSSGGSAAAVSAGLVPLAIGADGGGSCRIPAALTGIVSLKQTWGSRLDSPRDHEFAHSVGHICPLVATVDDARLAYELLATSDDSRFLAPPARIDYGSLGKGFKVCVDRAWNADSSADQQAAVATVEAKLKAAGASIVEVKLPFLRELFLAHVTTITSEMLASILPYGANLSMSDPDVQISLRAFATVSAAEFINAQIARNYLFQLWAHMWTTKCRVILSPATGSVATRAIPEPHGEIDLAATSARMKFSFPGNFLGYPAIAVPVDLTKEGLPTSVALHARNYDESVLFKAAKIIERPDQLKPNKNYYPTLVD
jgi:Asp-tRNA(Asn)/Glu-tRNA(Gln) amidotransferase A subunit family amidase